MNQSDFDVEAQAHTFNMSQASTIACHDDQLTRSSTVHWAVVVQGLDRHSVLDTVSLSHTKDGEHIWMSIRHHVYRSSLARCLLVMVARYFVHIVVGVGTIQKTHVVGSFEAATELPVTLHAYADDWRLTQEFQDPALLAQDKDYIAKNQCFAIDPSSVARGLEGQKAIVIRKSLDKTNITWLLIVLLSISPLLGLTIGILTHQAEVGIAVSAGIFALASFLQGLAAWFHV